MLNLVIIIIIILLLQNDEGYLLVFNEVIVQY